MSCNTQGVVKQHGPGCVKGTKYLTNYERVKIVTLGFYSIYGRPPLSCQAISDLKGMPRSTVTNIIARAKRKATEAEIKNAVIFTTNYKKRAHYNYFSLVEASS